ncbi:FG-GAP-like repeat-containing protein [Streptomyces vilmorinianum]|uniref:FG-GAP-like repeat-containing protein n=1 Tax=Streptomyces vilmorinianum TaxID=3051092 RepID=UPI0010FB6760|nr:FG-GAP-like repeat-containing protein [Streptomyces vilmorinianum]
MSSIRTTRRLAATITAVLAVTAGTLAAGPAVAAPGTEGAVLPASATDQQDVIEFPKDAHITFAGRTGFLTRSWASNEYRWTRFSDGVSTVLSNVRVIGVPGTDRVVIDNAARGGFALKDMATGSDIVVVPPEKVGYPDGWTIGAADSTILSAVFDGSGGEYLRLYSVIDGAVQRRTVTGLPSDADITTGEAGAEPGTANVSYSTGTKRQQAVVDLATATVVDIRDLPASGSTVVIDSAESETHRAWAEKAPSSWDTTVVVVERQTGATQRLPLGDMSRPAVGLAGDWVTYAEQGGLESYGPNPLYVLTARSLKDGSTRKLLDHVSSEVMAPDGTQLVRGGTLAQGEGLYRIAPSPDGTPVATLVATTGQPTQVSLVRHNIPSVIDLDRNSGVVNLDWELSRVNVDMTVIVRHARTGTTNTFYLAPAQDALVRQRIARLPWGDNAYNGDYTWQISARPLNGIGPTLTSSGTFKVVRKAAPHDYSDNGSPDVLLRDSSGRLTRIGSSYSPYIGQWVEVEKKVIGSGWGIYDQIEAVGNIAGASAGDLVARDSSGVLWEYLGKGDGTFAGRVKIGGGWGVYNKITGGSDLNGDGKSDLLATDKAGDLYLYKGTGNWSAPFSTRVKIGYGWGIYNQITAVGNIAGGAAGDLVARDKDGVLWLYLGNGDGTFATRIKIGGGWNTYTHLIGIGDADRDGRPDLYAYTPGDSYTMGTGYLYRGTGNWSAPFRGRELTGVDGQLKGNPAVA